MKRILLISNNVHHYRIKLYNTFYKKFKTLGFEFHVLSNSYKNTNDQIGFIKHELEFSVAGYVKKIRDINPVIVITFLHLKDIILIPLTLFCKKINVPVIYWGHGINNQSPNNFIKNIFYKYIHSISSSIILYTPDQLKYISKRNRKKTFIAYNTLDFSDINVNMMRDKNQVKNYYGIGQEFVVLYISRILPYKGLDVLLEILKDNTQIGLVIVGGGISEGQLQKIKSNSNYYYLGEKYNTEVNEIYNMGDVFSTPGHIGLAINHAFFWGKPVLLLNKRHAPEIYYMKNGETGFIVNSEEELKEKIILLSNDKNLLQSLSKNARQVAKTEMSVDSMYSGFISAINYCLNENYN